MDQPESDRQARLTLLDLFAGIAAAALFSAFSRTPVGDGSSVTAESVKSIYFLANLFIFTSGATGLFLFARRWWWSVPTDFQPGHWLLCLLGVMYPFVILHLLVQQLIFGSEILIRETEPLALAVLQVILLWAYLTAGILLPVRPWWRLVLIPQTLLELGMLGLLLSLVSGNERVVLFWFEQFKPLVLSLDIALLILFAVGDAWTTSERRDWIHWWGVAMSMTMSPVILLLELANTMGWLR